MSDTPRSIDLDEPRMRAYLLGDLPPSESADVETQVFDNDADYERLLDAQYDLIDAYARGTLSESERQAVERRLLTHPDGQRRIALARALSAKSAPATAPDSAPVTRPGSSIRRLALAAGFVLTAIGIGWLSLDNARLRRELARAVRPTTVDRPAAPTTLADASIPNVAEFVLSARVPRSDRLVTVPALPPAARFARLRLQLNEPSSSFTIAVERAGVGRVWNQRHERAPQAGELILWLPAEILSAGDYEVLVWRDREAVDTLVAVYPFRIASR